MGITGERTNFNFNPRSLAGATKLPIYYYLVFIFQSTLPRGSDLILYHDNMFNLYFNPRSLAGATDTGTPLWICLRYFNPRSLAGAT